MRPKLLAIVGALFCTEAVVIAMLPLCVCVMHHTQMALRHSCFCSPYVFECCYFISKKLLHGVQRHGVTRDSNVSKTQQSTSDLKGCRLSLIFTTEELFLWSNHTACSAERP